MESTLVNERPFRDQAKANDRIEAFYRMVEARVAKTDRAVTSMKSSRPLRPSRIWARPLTMWQVAPDTDFPEPLKGLPHMSVLFSILIDAIA